MNSWLANLLFVLGMNIFFVKGFGLEILGTRQTFRFRDVLQLWLWNLIASFLLMAIQWLLPGDLKWLNSILLPLTVLILWFLLSLFSKEDDWVLPLLSQSAALGVVYMSGNFNQMNDLMIACISASLGYIISLLILRELFRFVPKDLPDGTRFSILMASFALAALGMSLFGLRVGSV
jgi:hypothetical protein